MAPMGNFTWGPPPISAHASYGSCPTRSSTCGVSGRVPAGASRLFGTPFTRTVLDKEFSAPEHACYAAVPFPHCPTARSTRRDGRALRYT